MMQFPLGTPVAYRPSYRLPGTIAAVVVRPFTVNGVTDPGRVVVDCGPTAYAAPHDRDTRIARLDQLI